MSKFPDLRRDQRGFSLVELIVVIAVLGTLSLILVPTFSLMGDKAMGTAAATDARTILSLAIAFNMDHTDAMEQSDLNTMLHQLSNDKNASGSKSAVLNAADKTKITYVYERGGVKLVGNIDLTEQKIGWSVTEPANLSTKRRQAIAEGLKINASDLK